MEIATVDAQPRFHNRSALVWLYKVQVLSFVEAATPAIAHAAPSLLDRIDRIQRRFLNQVGLSEVQALENSGIALLSSRRAIAMLGLLYKIAHGTAHPQFRVIIPRAEPPREQRWTTTLALRHDKQLLSVSRSGPLKSFSAQHSAG